MTKTTSQELLPSEFPISAESLTNKPVENPFKKVVNRGKEHAATIRQAFNMLLLKNRNVDLTSETTDMSSLDNELGELQQRAEQTSDVTQKPHVEKLDRSENAPEKQKARRRLIDTLKSVSEIKNARQPFINWLKERDHEEKPTNIEFMGNLSLLQEFFQENPDAVNIIIFGGGGQKCILTAAFAKMLDTQGALRIAKLIGGVSSGTAGPYAALGKNFEQNKDIITQENCGKPGGLADLIGKPLFDITRWPPFRIKNLFQALKYRGIDVEAIKSGPPIIVPVTNIHAKTPEEAIMYIDITKLKDPTKGLIWGCAIPFVKNDKYEATYEDWDGDPAENPFVEGQKYEFVDSFLADGMPAEYLVKLAQKMYPGKKINLLACLNGSPDSAKSGMWDALKMFSHLPGVSPVVKTLMATREERQERQLAYLRQLTTHGKDANVRGLVLYTDTGIKEITQDVDALQGGYQQADEKLTAIALQQRQLMQQAA